MLQKCFYKSSNQSSFSVVSFFIYFFANTTNKNKKKKVINKNWSTLKGHHYTLFTSKEITTIF